MLNIKQFVFNPFDENTYLIGTDSGKDAIVVDPGMSNNAENARFDDYVTQNGLNITAVVLTHMHLDHCFGVAHVHNRYGAPVMASPEDAFLGATIAEQARRFGMRHDAAEDGVTIDRELHDGDTVKVGDDSLRVITVAGHSPGGLALYSAEGRVLLSGDSLFRRSIGRTDLPGGSWEQLVRDVRTKLLTLPPDTLVLPGHGPSTTIGEELRSNPFLA